MEKYSEDAFFFGNLKDYYSSNNKFDEAMQFADEMLVKDANNAFCLYVKGYLYHILEEFEEKRRGIEGFGTGH